MVEEKGGKKRVRSSSIAHFDRSDLSFFLQT